MRTLVRHGNYYLIQAQCANRVTQFEVRPMLTQRLL